MKNGQPIGEPFFPIVHSLFKSKKYRALPSQAKLTLQRMMFLHNPDKNGGLISLGVRDAADWDSISAMTAWRALQILQTAGFITEVHKGHLVPQVGRSNVSTTWRLNVAPFGRQEARPQENDQSTPAIQKSARNRQRASRPGHSDTGSAYHG